MADCGHCGAAVGDRDRFCDICALVTGRSGVHTVVDWLTRYGGVVLVGMGVLVSVGAFTIYSPNADAYPFPDPGHESARRDGIMVGLGLAIVGAVFYGVHRLRPQSQVTVSQDPPLDKPIGFNFSIGSALRYSIPRNTPLPPMSMPVWRSSLSAFTAQSKQQRVFTQAQLQWGHSLGLTPSTFVEFVDYIERVRNYHGAAGLREFDEDEKETLRNLAVGAGLTAFVALVALYIYRLAESARERQLRPIRPIAQMRHSTDTSQVVRPPTWRQRVAPQAAHSYRNYSAPSQFTYAPDRQPTYFPQTNRTAQRSEKVFAFLDTVYRTDRLRADLITRQEREILKALQRGAGPRGLCEFGVLRPNVLSPFIREWERLANNFRNVRAPQEAETFRSPYQSMLDDSYTYTFQLSDVVAIANSDPSEALRKLRQLKPTGNRVNSNVRTATRRIKTLCETYNFRAFEIVLMPVQ